MGGSVPIFDGNDFSYWKNRMQAYMESISPKVWEAASVGYRTPYTLEQAKWDGKARNAIFECINQEIHSRVTSKSKSYKIWAELIEIHEGSAKVREQKYDILHAKYDNFKMLGH